MMTREEAKKFGLHLLQGIMERNESYPVYANNVKQAIDALSESGSSEIPKDLEEAADEYVNNIAYCGDDIELEKEQSKRDFIAGVKWQKEQMLKGNPVIMSVEDFQALIDSHAKRVEEDYKEQIMKEAVEADVNIYRDLATGKSWAEFVVEMPTNNLGDKVRIIVCKNED